MRKIKVLRGKKASQTKVAIEPGEIAPVVLENFETLTNPKFKPKLELVEADPHNPPTMNTNTDQNITTDGEDSNRPSADDIARKAPEYENSNSVEKEKIPHEHEHVKQGSQAEELEKMKAEFTNKFTLASRLFDIKLAAGIEEEINKNNFVYSKADDPNESVDSLQKQVTDGEGFLQRIQASQNQKVANVPMIPTGFSGGTRHTSPFGDDLEAVIMGG